MFVKRTREQDIYLTDGASAGVKTVLEVGKFTQRQLQRVLGHLLRGNMCSAH